MAALRRTFSEYGLIRFRVLVECRWLQQLAQLPGVRCGAACETCLHAWPLLCVSCWHVQSIAYSTLPRSCPWLTSPCSEVPEFGPAANALLDRLATSFSVEEAQEVRLMLLG